MKIARSITDIARLAGGHSWAEEQICSILSGCIAGIAEPDARAFVGARCHQHAWHADMWRGRIPSIPGIDPLAVVAPVDDETARLFADVSTAEDPAERLAGVYRVLMPRLVSAYRSLVTPDTDTLDAPTVRIAKLVLRDEESDLLEAEALLRRP